MAVQSYSIEITAINLYKFGILKSGIPTVPDKLNSLNIYPQVQEVTIFESIFEPMIKCEIAVIDYIGLFVNFPLSGNEIVSIEWKNVGDDQTQGWIFAIDDANSISTDSKNRAVGFILKCVSIEALANNIGTVQQAYKGTSVQIAKQIYNEHIVNRVKSFFPSYRDRNVFAEDNETLTSTIVIPNMYPVAAIDMVQKFAISEVSDKYTYLFYQNARGFNFRTLQGLSSGTAARRYAKNNGYKYLSNEISDRDSKLNNEERLVSNLSFNRRHSAMQKLATGYFNNNLFEINIAQKAIHSTRTKTDDVQMMYKNKFDTDAFVEYAGSLIEGDEISNRVKYTITTRPESDTDFPVYRSRQRWGKDLISKIALSQVDITAVIPGTNRFAAGDLFYLEIPEFHGFNEIKEDDLVTGYFIITEIKHIITMGGYQTTVLRLNKDSYASDINRASRYVT